MARLQDLAKQFRARLKDVGEFGSDLAGGLTEGSRTFGRGINNFVYEPFERKRREKDTQTNQVIQDMLNRQSARAAKSGKSNISGKLRIRARDYGQNNPLSGEVQRVKNSRRDVTTGGARTALNLFGLGAKPAAIGANLAFGGVIGGAQAAFTGKDISKGIGRGAGESVKFAGLNRLTAPVINPIVRSVGGRAPIRLVGRGAAGAITNLAEDEFFTKAAEGRTPTNRERAFSLGVGALGGQLASDVPDALKTTRRTGINVTQSRDRLGRFSKEQIEKRLKPVASKIKEARYLSEVKGLGDGKKLVKVADRKYKIVDENLQNASGLVAGVEFDTDEKGKITNVRVNPTKALTGVALSSGIKSKQGQAVLKIGKKEAKKRLQNIFNYPDQLKELGYTDKQIRRISAPKAQKLIDNQIFGNSLDPLQKQLGDSSTVVGGRAFKKPK